ncbi:TPA: hypothetical protein RFW98_001806 [Klebsiella aerogenes]|nr:hypothetical protein [Klebsiella aerogenes]MBE0175975.1 hypothetical protein [Klebsiella aerogenes]HDH0708495.1 hypothetical protein [Klebsiella aerogenes]HDU6101108.1 hypothetical protein [Klebsiella aerogenes]
MVILAVLTERKFRFSLFISQLLATAIPVRGARFKKACLRAGFFISTTLAFHPSEFAQIFA